MKILNLITTGKLCVFQNKKKLDGKNTNSRKRMETRKEKTEKKHKGVVASWMASFKKIKCEAEIEEYGEKSLSSKYNHLDNAVLNVDASRLRRQSG